MLSQPSLFKLLSHLPPARFSGWITATTGETAPADLPIAVRPARSLLRGWLESFDALTLDRLEHFAERILLLSDRLGCEVLAGLRCALIDDARGLLGTDGARRPKASRLAKRMAISQPQLAPES